VKTNCGEKFDPSKKKGPMRKPDRLTGKKEEFPKVKLNNNITSPPPDHYSQKKKRQKKEGKVSGKKKNRGRFHVMKLLKNQKNGKKTKNGGGVLVNGTGVRPRRSEGERSHRVTSGEPNRKLGKKSNWGS